MTNILFQKLSMFTIKILVVGFFGTCFGEILQSINKCFNWCIIEIKN